jgi:hypothetical protein
MTKVEDLKRVIVAIVADANFDEEMDAHRNQITLEQCKIDAEADVDLLISASHAEGVAEGVVTALNGLARYAKRIDGGEYNYAFGKPFFVVPVTAFEEVRVSLLAPKEQP